MRYVRLEERENTGHVAAREVRRHDPFFVWGRGCEAGCGSWWERFEAGWVRGCLWFEAGSRRAAVDSLRAALSSARKVGMRGWGSSCLRIGSALRSLPAVRRLLMGREVGAVRGCLWFGAGSRRAAVDSLRAALSSARKVEDARMGLVVPPNRLRAALAARCPSAADGVRGGSVRGGLWFEAGSRWVRGGSGSRWDGG